MKSHKNPELAKLMEDFEAIKTKISGFQKSLNTFKEEMGWRRVATVETEPKKTSTGLYDDDLNKAKKVQGEGLDKLYKKYLTELDALMERAVAPV